MSCKVFKKNGFGLIEVVVVVAIFSMCLAAIIPITSMSYKNLAANENRWKATMLAQNVFESMRNQRDNNLLQGIDWATKLGSSSNPCPAGCQYDADMISGGSFFNLSLEISSFGAPINTYVYTTSVSWSQFGQTKSVEYKTILKDISKWVD